MTFIHRVLVPTDFSDHALRAFDYAAELAALYDAPLVVAHIYAVPILYAVGEPVVAMPPPDVDGIRAELDSSLQELVARGIAAGVPEVHVALTGGDAPHEIVRIAKERACDLIVMGTHGRTGFKHLVLGSIAEKVIRMAECPVLTVSIKAAEHLKSAAH